LIRNQGKSGGVTEHKGIDFGGLVRYDEAQATDGIHSGLGSPQDGGRQDHEREDEIEVFFHVSDPLFFKV
jgi:hypothetical protein